MSRQINNSQEMHQQDLSHEQYQSVLKYMETTNQQSFDAAVNALKTHNFRLQNAVSSKLGINENTHENNNYGFDFSQGSSHHHQQNQQAIRAARNMRIQNDIRKYLQFVKQKQNKSLISGICSFTKNFIVGIVSGITELLCNNNFISVPQFLLRKIYRSRFYNMYQDKILPQFRDKRLSFILKNSGIQRKPIMFIISAPETIHQSVVSLLNRVYIAKKINQSFILVGSTTAQEKQVSQIQGEKSPPSIIFCRKNVYEQIQITRRVIGQTAILALDIDKLNYILRDHQRSARKDRNLLIRYRNYIRRNYYGGRAGYYEEEEDQQQQLYYPNNHSSIINPSIMETQTSKATKSAIISDMIKQQNEEYRRTEQQQKRKRSQQILQKQKHLQIQQERKIRKMSIPQQPLDGQQLIKFNFRCPDGTSKARNFHNQQKMDLLFHWVETNQQIQFQDNKKRQFQLMHGFPPVSLGSRRQEKLKDIFESDQQKILIRQL